MLISPPTWWSMPAKQNSSTPFPFGLRERFCVADRSISPPRDHGVPGTLGVLAEAFQLPVDGHRIGYGGIWSLLAGGVE
ncbi:hypothetical protein BHE74_00018864 [Ensete ventricosum]|nr:hypothetical protein BHE74_00018864 [Ensete ventricosum]RZR96216.1 hypothetical protein BHM03_00025198 [Ensete ventricosum]